MLAKIAQLDQGFGDVRRGSKAALGRVQQLDCDSSAARPVARPKSVSHHMSTFGQKRTLQDVLGRAGAVIPGRPLQSLLQRAGTPRLTPRPRNFRPRG